MNTQAQFIRRTALETSPGEILGQNNFHKNTTNCFSAALAPGIRIGASEPASDHKQKIERRENLETHEEVYRIMPDDGTGVPRSSDRLLQRQKHFADTKHRHIFLSGFVWQL